MKLNEYKAVLTPNVLLVPYSEHHVPTYHEWMKDEELQKATASEPLTLDQEHLMQHSWREDADKLTFITCLTPPSTVTVDKSQETSLKDKKFKLTPGKEDASDRMIGDVNLFLYADDGDNGEVDRRLTDEKTRSIIHERNLQGVVGEVEIMVARKEFQGKGLGKEILLAFLWYIVSSFVDITNEYHRSHGRGKTISHLKYLRVKIDGENARSIKLFEGAGFKKVDEKPNYFGELELRWPISVRSLNDIELNQEAVPLIVDYK
ncbi:hypothetical protein K469DRAFT_328672 [Zopfia rhizophila CBS 207.26]|uniref:N-acetyltransferase domain-containing protein n=1 Tax=Zopfia rhizophila CBS 207.26 TaxID=1314779 RepID=A0A6A6DLN9_9PEZI|nr:hypothetical protein K469DRAFT_328672 [Zopfia rhizophila CBS 207.26]